MAQRVNGLSGMIDRVVRDCEMATLGDTGELAKIFARLERLAESLFDDGHYLSDMAQKLCVVVEHFLGGDVSEQGSFYLIKKGVLALQEAYLNAGGNDGEDLIDSNLITQLNLFIDQVTLGDEAPAEREEADGVNFEDKMDRGYGDTGDGASDSDSLQPLDTEMDENINLDGVAWKRLPDVDLDALEKKVAQEQLESGLNAIKEGAVDEITEDATGEDEGLAVEAQEIRAQLSETGYIVFDQDDDAQITTPSVESLENELGDLVDDGDKGEEDVAEVESLQDVESDSENVVDDGLGLMSGAVTAFLNETPLEISDTQADATPLSEQVVEDMPENDEADNPLEMTEADDVFWEDAEPLSNPDPEVVSIVAQTEPLVEVTDNSVLAQIALDAMILDLDDMSGLGRVHTQLETLASEYGDCPLSEQLTKALAVVIEKVILFDCDDVDDPLALICDGVAMLQEMEQMVNRGVSERFTNDALLAQIMKVAEIDLNVSQTVEVASVDDKATNTQLGPIDVDQDIFFDFASEADEHLETAASKLLELESNTEDKEVINAVFRAFHTIKGASSFLNLEDVTRVAHCVEDVLDSGRKGSLVLTPSILDVALESLDLLAQLIGQTKESLENGRPVYAQDVTGFVTKVERIAAGESVADIEEEADSSALKISSDDEQVQTPEQGKPKTEEPLVERRGQSREQSYVRVGTEKLDQLVNLVGELVIAQTQVSQNPDVLNTQNQKLPKDISQLMKISTDIQEISMSMRMVPIRSTFERMARIIRDLARKCGKQVRLEMSGEDTDLDKNVVEELVDPLTHMVRNAVDHGIESEDDRLTMGKPAHGSVHLNAYHKGGNIVIELRDDGQGLDRDKIFKKAVERGLIQSDAQLNDEEIFALIFQPGFSTAEQISDISGRGVGMDVVRRNIEGLRGRVEVTSELGKGSTFTIRLPLTLAIIDGMVIGVGAERYILPMTAIVRSLRPEKDDVFYVMGKGEMIRLQEEILPVVRLYKRFGVCPLRENIWESLVVVVEAEGKRCGVMVDELLGMQQVVIKGLVDHLRKEPCLSGCAILGDGRVGLILDANGVVRQENKPNKVGDGQEAAYRSAS